MGLVTIFKQSSKQIVFRLVKYPFTNVWTLQGFKYGMETVKFFVNNIWNVWKHVQMYVSGNNDFMVYLPDEEFG